MDRECASDMTAGVAVAEVTGLWQLGREEGDLKCIGSAVAGSFHIGEGSRHVNSSGEMLERAKVSLGEILDESRNLI